MSASSRLKLLDSTWFRRPVEIGGMALGPVSATTFLLLDRIGHPLLGAGAVSATPEMLLDYLWIHFVDFDSLCDAFSSDDPAAYVRKQALGLGLEVGPSVLEELGAAMGAASAELAAAATARAAEDDEEETDEGKPAPAGPRPTSSPPSSPPSTALRGLPSRCA